MRGKNSVVVMLASISFLLLCETGLAAQLFDAPRAFPIGVRPQSIAIGDLDRDGILDLAVTNGGSNNVSILLGNRDGTFRTAVSYGTGDEPRSVSIGDLNRDGIRDLAVVNGGSNNVSVLLGNG